MQPDDSFEALYTEYFSPVYRYLYFRVSNTPDAEDLTQEVFLKAYASFHRYTASEFPLAYFYTIARNCLIDHYRKKRIPVVDEEVLEAVPDESNSAEEEAIQRDDAQTLKRYLAQLPLDQQDAITLKYTEGLETKEIAALMQKSEMAIRQLQSRGIRTIKNMLQNND